MQPSDSMTTVQSEKKILYKLLISRDDEFDEDIIKHVTRNLLFEMLDMLITCEDYDE